MELLFIVPYTHTILFCGGGGVPTAPDDGIAAIGSGGNYALAAARALYQNTDFTAADIAKKSLKIASEICVFTNDNIKCEVI